MEENKNLQAGASHPVFFFFCANILREKIFRYPQRNVLQYIKTTPQNYQAAVKPCGLKWIKVLHDRKKNKLGFKGHMNPTSRTSNRIFVQYCCPVHASSVDELHCIIHWINMSEKLQLRAVSSWWPSWKLGFFVWVWRLGESTKTTQLAVHTGGNNSVEPTPTNLKLTTALGAATHSLFIVRNTNSFQKLYPIRTFV